MQTPRRFTERTLKVLRKSGWFEGRCVDTRAYEQALTDAAYSVHRCALAFLAEFGGLGIAYILQGTSPLDGLHAGLTNCEPRHLGTLQSLEKHHQVQSLCLVGWMCSEWDLFMSCDGVLVAEHDSLTFRVADSPDEMIERICDWHRDHGVHDVVRLTL